MESSIRMHIHRGRLVLIIEDMGAISFDEDQVEHLIKFWWNRPAEDTITTIRELLEEPPTN